MTNPYAQDDDAILHQQEFPDEWLEEALGRLTLPLAQYERAEIVGSVRAEIARLRQKLEDAEADYSKLETWANAVHEQAEADADSHTLAQSQRDALVKDAEADCLRQHKDASAWMERAILAEFQRDALAKAAGKLLHAELTFAKLREGLDTREAFEHWAAQIHEAKAAFASARAQAMGE